MEIQLLPPTKILGTGFADDLGPDMCSVLWRKGKEYKGWKGGIRVAVESGLCDMEL